MSRGALRLLHIQRVLRLAYWLLGHPLALFGLARGASPRDLILREDLRGLGYDIPFKQARGLGESRLNVRLVTKLADTFSGAYPRTLLDVGAARGSFSRAAAIAFGGIRSYAFEPLPGEFAVLRRGVQRAFPFALGDRTGPATIHVSANAGSSSLARMLGAHVAAFPGTGVVREHESETRRLDDVVETEGIVLESPVLMKIDVQGAEHRVLRGAVRTLERVDALIVEMSLRPLYEDQLIADAMTSELAALGFRHAATFDEIRTAGGELVQVDGLFRRA